jgi:hypothetical protein
MIYPLMQLIMPRQIFPLKILQIHTSDGIHKYCHKIKKTIKLNIQG